MSAGWDIYGNPWDVDPDLIADMFQPVRCLRCQGLYDLGTVEITHRYSDCTLWRTPCCKQAVDDRGETGWKSFQDYQRLNKDGSPVRRGDDR